MIMFNFDLNLYIIVPSTIFFYCLFNGYLSLNIIKYYLNSQKHPLTGIILKSLGVTLLICLVLYLFGDIAYAMGNENNDLPKPEVKVTTGDMNNSVTIKDSTINIPNAVATGLTNLGTGAAVAAGLKAGASIAKTSGLSPTAKMGALIVGGLSAGAIVAGTNAANSIFQKKIDSAAVNPTLSNTISSSNTGSNGPGSAAFSIEPDANIDTVMTLLNSLYILQFCIIYLI